MKHISLIILIISLFLNACDNKNPNDDLNKELPYVVMLSLDGFRWDYANRVNTPNFDYITQNGVKAEFLKPCFPTKTFPNHYSMATGLYPDNHGIVNNTFYAPDLEKWYWISNREAVENPDFYFGEPIWATAEKQDILTASYFWVGSEAPIQGIQPHYWKIYDHNFPYSQRIDTVMHWLNLDYSERPHLITFYFDQPDGDGHYYGPDSDEINTRVKELDTYLGQIISRFESLAISDSINFIIVSDHGMGQITPDKVNVLENHIDLDWCEIIAGGNPIYNMKAKPEYYNQIFDQLNQVEHLTIWKNNEIPEKYHYGLSDRTLDFTIVADSSWSLIKYGSLNYPGGTHGYVNDNTDMYGIFYAIGPAFKSSFVHEGFENVNIYPLICEILGIEPVTTDGDLSKVNELLKN